MKSIKIIISLTGIPFALLIPSAVDAQGTFQNFDFEQASPISVDGTSYVTAASALPNWTVTIGGVQQTQIPENDPSTGAPAVVLVGPGIHFGYSPIAGNYSVLLQGTSLTAAISQTGLIPSGTQSLLFEAQPGFAPLDVFVEMQTVPFAIVGTGPNYTLYGANISAWAGDTEDVTFSAPISSGNWVLDNIAFSPMAVPEPNPLALTGAGALLFTLYSRLVAKS